MTQTAEDCRSWLCSNKFSPRIQGECVCRCQGGCIYWLVSTGTGWLLEMTKQRKWKTEMKKEKRHYNCAECSMVGRSDAEEAWGREGFSKCSFSPRKWMFAKVASSSSSKFMPCVCIGSPCFGGDVTVAQFVIGAAFPNLGVCFGILHWAV